MRSGKPSVLLLAASAFVVALGSVVDAPSAMADECITTAGVGYTVTCTGSASFSSHTAPERMTPVPSKEFPTVNHVPCTVQNTHLCRARAITGNEVGPVP